MAAHHRPLEVISPLILRSRTALGWVSPSLTVAARMVSFQCCSCNSFKMMLRLPLLLSALGCVIVFLQCPVQQLIESTSGTISKVATGMNGKSLSKLCLILCGFRRKKFTKIIAEERGKGENLRFLRTTASHMCIETYKYWQLFLSLLLSSHEFSKWHRASPAVIIAV